MLCKNVKLFPSNRSPASKRISRSMFPNGSHCESISRLIIPSVVRSTSSSPSSSSSSTSLPLAKWQNVGRLERITQRPIPIADRFSVRLYLIVQCRTKHPLNANRPRAKSHIGVLMINQWHSECDAPRKTAFTILFVSG